MFTYKIIDVQATVAQPGKLRVVLLSEMGVQIVVYCKKNLKGHLRPGFTIKFHTWDDSPFEWIENSIGGLNPIDGDHAEMWKTQEDILKPAQNTSNAWDSDEKLAQLARKAADTKFLQEICIRPDDDIKY